MDSNFEQIVAAAYKAQELVNDLYVRDRSDSTFDHAGNLDGHAIVKDLVEHNEWGLAPEHLLYMIHESESVFPADELERLHSIASRNDINNPYDGKGS